MDPVVGGVLVLVYVGMILGEVPSIHLDRAGIALAGAAVLLATGRLSAAAAWSAIDLPTLVVLLGMMGISGYFRAIGAYAAAVRWIDAVARTPLTLLALVIAAAGVLSAVLAGWIVALAMTPLLIRAAERRRLDPVPFLIALVCAATIGSAATIIASPQTVLIGQALDLPFARYLADAGVPAAFGLAIVGLVVWVVHRHRWHRDPPEGRTLAPLDDQPRFIERGRTWLGAVVVMTMILLLAAAQPAAVVVPGAALLLAASRPTAAAVMFRAVDWRLLLLLVGLFIVTRGIAQSGLVSGILMTARGRGLDLATNAPGLFGVGAVLSALATQLPAAILLLPAARDEIAGAALALATTFAGNWLLGGSLAHAAVAQEAARLGHRVRASVYRRVGIPVTLATIGVALMWLLARGA